MRALKINKLPGLLLSICYLVCSLILFAGTAYADTKPYLKISGADIFTGGWYESFSAPSSFNCDTGGNYQAPSFPLNNKFNGGILGFANYDGGTNKVTGASGDFGVMALGLVEGSTTGYGFGSNGGTGKNSLTFSNSNSNGLSSDEYWGGFSEGSTRQQHNCIKDYYDLKKQDTPPDFNGSISGSASGQYKVEVPGASTYTINADSVGAGKSITLFINGNTYIKGNITYAGHNANSVPKLAVIVKNGSIYIDSGVTQLDGIYIAQPDPAKPVGDDSGIIWTCTPGGTGGLTDKWINGNCRKNFQVNGALIAKQVNLFRVSGDVSSTPAEVINFTPEMIIGGPFFNPPSSTELDIESLISLPPVF